MPPTLTTLEDARTRLLQGLSQLGDFRSGSVTSAVRRCGKPNCHCAQPHDPGHGPDFRLTYKVNGKTRTESLPTPAARHKAEREVAEFRKFQQLSRDLVETSTAICRLRPVDEEPATEQEKKPRKRSGKRSRGK